MYARISLISFVVVSTLLMSFSAGARPRIPPPRVRPATLSVSLEDDRGHSLRTFRHRGQTFVLGNMGRRYNIRVRNHSPERVEVVVSVDGRDVVHGRSSQLLRDRGYVLPAHGSVVIRGFRTSLSSVAAFRFTSPGESFAGRHGQAQRVGVIEVAAFRERAQPVTIAKPRMRRGATSADRRSSRRPSATPQPAPARPSMKKRPAPRPRGRRAMPRDVMVERSNNLGTQFGERMQSRVRETRFIRARPTMADQRITLRYDNARGLEARGIRVFRKQRPWRRPVRPQRPLRQSRFAQPPPARR